jgi:GNAT superfamily N-acetyltransferase
MDPTPDTSIPSLELRPACLEDAPVLRSILHAAFEEYRDKLDPPSGAHHETVEVIARKLQEGQAVMALVAGQPAGCVFCQPKGDHLYLGRLAVLPAYRRRGVARGLIDYVEQQAKTMGFPCVQLGVRIALPHVCDYYLRLGYGIVDAGTHAGYPEPTFYVMEKEIH